MDFSNNLSLFEFIGSLTFIGIYWNIYCVYYWKEISFHINFKKIMKEGRSKIHR